jgi:predicted RNase H-like HicB family nuclease
MKCLAIYEKTSSGYSCSAPDPPGWVAAGDDLPEITALKERAIEIYLAAVREDGETVPESTTTAEYLEVRAA